MAKKLHGVSLELSAALPPQFPLLLLRLVCIWKLPENLHKYRGNECREWTGGSISIQI